MARGGAGMSTPLVAVIQFPGSNCEYETKAVIDASGMQGRIFRWNQWRELNDASPDAFILPGGFSFQDRVRAGAVGAKERIMDFVVERAGDGLPVLGICNGAQILVESGLVPGWTSGSVQAGLASNHIEGRSGYLSRWTFLKVSDHAQLVSPWLSYLSGKVVPVPIAHAEGRFVFFPGDAGRIADCSALVYCDENGEESPDYPINPNGSTENLAGIMNPAGNVLAMMPHPERAFWLWQVPIRTPGEWGDRRISANHSTAISISRGPGELFFRGLAESLAVTASEET